MKKLLLYLPLSIIFITNLACNAAYCEYSAPFLKIDMGARPAGLGGAFCAISDDINAVNYNIGGLAQLENNEILLVHNEWIEGIRGEYFAFAHPVEEKFVWVFALNYMYMDGLIERTISGAETGNTFGAKNTAFIFGASKYLYNECSAGAGIKVINESVKNKSGVAYAVDTGLFFDYEDFRIGISVQNLGSKLKLYEDSFSLPLSFNFGIGLELLKNLDVAMDVNNRGINDTGVKLGVEYLLAEIVTLRMGYKANPDENTGSGVTGGLGLGYGSYDIDYAFLPLGDLGNTHRISLKVSFDNELLKSLIGPFEPSDGYNGQY